MRQGAVRNLRVSGNTVYAEVQGSRKTPYRVSFQLRPWSPSQRHRFLQEIQRYPTLSRALLNDQFPSELTHVFQASNVTLFPASPETSMVTVHALTGGTHANTSPPCITRLAHDPQSVPCTFSALRGLDVDTLVQHIKNSDDLNRWKIRCATTFG